MKSVLACVLLSSVAIADGKGVVTDKLVAKVEPLRKLAVADREAEFCADSAAILELANAIPEGVPAGVPLDKTIWLRFSGAVSSDADFIHDTCKTKTHSRKDLDGVVVTVASRIGELYKSLDALVAVAKPRALPAPLAAVRKSVDSLNWQSSTFCTQAKSIPAGLAKVTKPAGSPPTWDPFFDKLKQTAFGVETAACAKGKKVPEEVGILQPGLAEAFYALVLLVPAAKAP